MKKCNKCGDLKPNEMFGIHKGSKDGRKATCKVCYNITYNRPRYTSPVQVVSRRIAEKDMNKCERRPQIDPFTGEPYSKEYYELDFGL